MWSRWLPRLLGPCLLLFFLGRVDWQALSDRLGQLRPVDLVLASLLMVPILPLRAWRWSRLLGVHKEQCGFRNLLDLYAFSAFAGALTPGQLGELAKVVQLRRYAVPYGIALFSTLADRVADLGWLLVCGWLFLLVMGHEAGVALGVLLLFVPVCLIGLWGLVRYQERLPSPIAAKWQLLQSGVPGVNGGDLVLIVVTTILAWLLNWWAIDVAAGGLGLDLSLPFLSGMMALCALTAVVPVSILGMGTRDAVLLFVLAHYATDAVLALSGVVLVLRLFYAGICAYALFRVDVANLRKEKHIQREP